MGVIEIILLIIRVGSALVPLISEIWDLIHKVKDKPMQAAFTTELNEAVSTYKKTRDRRPLRALREKLYKHCDDSCSPPTPPLRAA